MMMPSPAPAIEDPDLARSADLRWHVDLELLGSAMPRGRGLDGQSLFAPGENIYLTNVRSGRDGITYDAARLDFVPAGTAPAVQAGAAPAAGTGPRRVGTASRRAIRDCPSGCRPQGGALRRSGSCGTAGTDFVGSMTGQLLPVLRAFQPSHAQSSDAYPGGEGVVLLNGVREGYLTFAGMLKYAGDRHQPGRSPGRRRWPGGPRGRAPRPRPGLRHMRSALVHRHREPGPGQPVPPLRDSQ